MFIVPTRGTNAVVRVSGGFRGAGWRTLLPQEFDPLPTQKVPLLYYFEIFIFGDGLLWRQCILILGWERAPKKRNFLVKIFQKVPKKWPVFENFDRNKDI